MSKLSRIFLLSMAIALIVVVFGLGSSFSLNAEPNERTFGGEWLWLLLAVVFASPFWIPAVFATGAGTVTTVICLLSAGASLIPLRYAGAVMLHQAQLFPHPSFSATIFAVAAALSAGCVAAVVILLLPVFYRLGRKAS
jgi:hypothetical protein